MVVPLLFTVTALLSTGEAVAFDTYKRIECVEIRMFAREQWRIHDFKKGVQIFAGHWCLHKRGKPYFPSCLMVKKIFA